MVRKLLDLRAMLIVLAVFVGLALIAMNNLFAGAVVALEMPHIEGGTEVTFHNVMHKVLDENGGHFVLPPVEPDPIPEPSPESERNECGIGEGWIARSGPWIQ